MVKPKLPVPPKEPHKPVPPKPPSKTIEITHSISIDPPFTVAQLIEKVPKNIGHDKVTIDFSSDYSYDSCDCNLEVHYTETIDNKNYDKEYKKYQLKLKKHAIKLFEYKEDHKDYLIKRAKYNDEKDAYDKYKNKEEYETALKIVKAWEDTKW